MSRYIIKKKIYNTLKKNYSDDLEHSMYSHQLLQFLFDLILLLSTKSLRSCAKWKLCIALYMFDFSPILQNTRIQNQFYEINNIIKQLYQRRTYRKVYRFRFIRQILSRLQIPNFSGKSFFKGFKRKLLGFCFICISKISKNKKLYRKRNISNLSVQVFSCKI